LWCFLGHRGPEGVRKVTRDEFVDILTEKVKNGQKIVFFSPKSTQKLSENSNSSQENEKT
jgi:hypothetical protein